MCPAQHKKHVDNVYKPRDCNKKTVFAATHVFLCYSTAMKRLTTFLAVTTFAALNMGAGVAYAASPYDEYYNNHYGKADPANTAQPIDNDSYYAVPGTQYPTDNDAYYSPPGAYSDSYPATTYPNNNCNTIGDMPSCGSD